MTATETQTSPEGRGVLTDAPSSSSAARAGLPDAVGPYTVIGVVGEGGMGAVYRARHKETGQTVALKIAIPGDGVSVESVRREIRLLGRIRHPGVIGMLDHGVYELRPWYAMELVEGERLTDWLARLWPREAAAHIGEDDDTRPLRGPNIKTPPTGGAAVDTGAAGEPPAAADRAPQEHLREVVQLFAGLSQTLGYLHGEGIVHLDLKPANVLLRPDGQPVLVDFGITRQVAGGLNREVLNIDPLEGGTEAYMAPEQIAGAATDARTDLYSLGCILYEALTGRPPFLPTTTRGIREQHLEQQPLPPSSFVTGVPASIDAAVLHLLEKAPERRFGYAGELLDLLIENGARLDPELAARKPKPYLYRPRLIGREALMEQLQEELARAQRGVGRCVFLVGPSGSGKTRAVMELGRYAFAAGMRVVSGECAPLAGNAGSAGSGSAGDGSSGTTTVTAHDGAGGGGAHARPLHPFQSLLHTVIDLCNAGGPDVTAALVGDALPVLENLEPALARVVGRDRFPETLDAVSAFGRTEQALSATIVATAQATPMLLIIDDLQWADALSLAVIRALIKLPDTSHVCVLLTCRKEDMGGELLDLARASTAARYDVAPLASKDTEALIAGMLAREDPDRVLVDTITARAQGNPFYVAEYLQAAVNSGQLKREKARGWILAKEELQLPETPAVLLELRVHDLDDRCREVLEMAAVLGRSFPRHLLRRQKEGGSVAEEIEELLYRGILVEEGARWLRFSHDKLREASYAGISADRRRALHAGAARAIAADDAGASGGVPGGSDTAIITTAALGERPSPASLERAALLAHHNREAGNVREHFEYARLAGELASRVGAHQQAQATLREALDLLEAHPELATNPREEAHLWGRYGAVLETLGEVDVGVPALEKGLALLGHRVPQGGAALGAYIVAQAVRQLGARLFGGGPSPGPSSSLRAQAAEVAAALARGYVGTNRQLNVIGAVLLSANLAERAGADTAVVHAHAFLGGIAGLLKMPSVAAGYFARAQQAAERVGTLDAALTHAQLEGFYHMSRADWPKTTAVLAPVLERALKASALHIAEPPLLMLNYVHMLQGDLARAGEHTATLLHVARKTGNERTFLIASLAEALHDMYRGAFAAALARLEALEDRVLAFDELIHVANFHATRAGLLSWLERHEEAVAFADRAVELVKETGARNALLYNVHAFTPETYLRACDVAVAAGRDPADLIARARRAVKASAQFSGVCEYAEPFARRFAGQLALLQRKAGEGLRALEEAAAAGKRQGNLYEEAMAARALAAIETLGAAERARFAKQAEDNFVKLGHHPFAEELSLARAVVVS